MLSNNVDIFPLVSLSNIVGI